MPRFMRQKTVREAEYIFLTKSEKALGVVRKGKITYYPRSSYNLNICANEDAKIKGLRRVY